MQSRLSVAAIFSTRDRCVAARMRTVRRKRNFFSQDARESAREDASAIESARISAQ
jgi:hypothetical protein